ncbi:MAG: DUF4962 domain-containing protein, partial [Candidatus Diapherotrites archaeon]|nr:DUF4962 domain-containing protein [Candidatus Diapherotrites archaeon]
MNSTTKWGPLLFFLIIVSFLASAAITIDDSAIFEEDPESWYSKYVNFAPGNGSTVDINPPRFRWFEDYAHIDGCQPNEWECGDFCKGSLYEYTLQVATDSSFNNKVVNVENIHNMPFYNMLEPLNNGQTYYWRVGYKNLFTESPRYGEFNWSPTMQFTIAPNAVIWDRSMFSFEEIGEINTSTNPHPRMFLKPSLVQYIKDHINEPEYTVPKSRIEKIISIADTTIEKEWYDEIPNWTNDMPDEEDIEYDLPWSATELVKNLAYVAFAYKWTGDSKYNGVKQRMLKIAEFEVGSKFSPEGWVLQSNGGYAGNTGEESGKWMGLMYDWLYNDMTPAEREKVQKFLEWRIRAFTLTAWGGLANKTDALDYIRYGAPPLPYSRKPGSHGKAMESHSLGNVRNDMPSYIALLDKSQDAKYLFQYKLSHWMAVGHFGFDTPSQGIHYSMTLQDSEMLPILMIESAFPEFEINKNPYWENFNEFIARIAPIGMTNAPWGRNCD